ncbi:uncharacterized protein GGS22DRAFT_170496 [Annulohypoxylon maeteangense]|uniref:uncharacterized protein n=1 Tax=Annulohypoxylon maeteangense TaxID=1927788 RepID=UPI002007926A|nr:uncharacterized protein GGS22DRAFT_170496 [Annulohypoxylon maeteangense]KAI0882227.1 hypothetical protein GGS22DRAFT_170496 [Annulohypoxylon maeteangense]
MTLALTTQVVSQDITEDIVQDVLDDILDDVLDDIEEGGEVYESEGGDYVPSTSYNNLAIEKEVAPYDEAALRQRIATVIAMLDDFCKSRRKTETGVADKDDAKPQLDMACSEESTTPVSTGFHSPLAFDAQKSDTSYSEEPSCEIEELKIEDLALEEPTLPPHHLIETEDMEAYGEIPFAHLVNPEKYSNQYFEVKKSKISGNGVFAKVNLKQGQLIHVERPQIVACPESLYDVLEELSPEIRNAFLRMHCHKRCSDQDDLHSIFLTNA